jgi:small-conductance mechanosensitive channel
MNPSQIVLQADGGDLFGNLPGWLGNALSEIVAALPRLVGAIVILVIGWIVGAALGKVVSGVADRAGIDRRANDTPLGRMMGGSPDALSIFLGKVTAWFVYALAILAAANTLAIPILSEWIATAVSYLPAFIAGLLVIIGGFIVADFIGDAITRTRGATRSQYTEYFASGIRMFLYFTAIVIGLDTMGIDVEILYLFARAMAWGLAAGVALAVGIAFGWGGHDYVANHIDQWMGRARQSAPSSQSGQSETTDDD